MQDKGIAPEIVLYLESPPSVAEIQNLLLQLGLDPIELVRKGEAIWKEQFKGKQLSDAEIVEAMAAHPKLIERPIVINGTKAALGRPPENVLKIL